MLASHCSKSLLLPRNVVVREDEASRVRVEFMDPNAVLELVGKVEITQLAAEVWQKLARVMAALPYEAALDSVAALGFLIDD